MAKVKMDKGLLLKIMKDMLLSRHFEEKVNEMFMQGRIHGTTHLGIGQEALHGGVSNALRKDDWILPNHRGHGHCIAKGATPRDIMAELFAIEDGVCKGLGGSMHIIDTKNNNLGNSGIVGGAISLAAGMAMAFKKQGKDNIACVMFGDGASNQGTFHEVLNMASIWKLPVLFLCENNLYGMSCPAKYSLPIEDIASRAAGYDIPSMIIDGNDVMEVYEAIKEASDLIRSGKGPILIEAKTYRWLGHSKSDQRKYRTREEEAQWKEKCPIKRFKEKLIDNKMLTQKEFEQLELNVEKEIEEAVEFCKDRSIIKLEEALNYVYCQ